MRPPRGGGRDGGFRGGGRRGGGGFRGGFRGGARGFRDEGPPEEVVAISTFSHACEGEAVVKLVADAKIPKFNAAIFLENKAQIGRVEEIFGPINEPFFSIKMQDGIVATSYHPGDKFYIDPRQTLELTRFTQPQAGGGGFGRGGGRGGGGRGRGRGGGFRGGRNGGGGGFRGGRSSGGGGFRGRARGRGRF
ncbi:hypothetical protein SELMODRAFT_266974 [Selaginella moellendorffii]|uniref:H/ACA ribonucleoprotein complex subunit n=1 Tax=Selaginella moellendorffii TaxID=88036 RepID=D8R5G8_SELML|nr:H/ACA ribonucleoprotein complex subunit 1 [Selaginella moellendorffii]XP_024543038.1 H/ACA ribonucleoprotein complex subunit 1-like [Selaginella moellendorffii]EFJ32482.1 hypothetical protein SELMODRAFT_266974 [Selaginella moellendorffii]|eukprot:XP_002966455.1 H/ACA ribonucleoprotein complex subunit 1 [Selaginella moellendorffii]